METMATDGRRTASSVEDELFEEGDRFDFFQVVRLLALRRSREVGRRGVAAEWEPVRFRASVDMGFPPTEVVRVERPRHEGEPPELTVAFLGLAGALGPLPRPFAQQVADRARVGDTAQRDFLDIFHHRLLALLYRVRQARRVGLELGRPETHEVAGYLRALLGLEGEAIRRCLGRSDRWLLRYAGLLARRPCSLVALETLLSDFFGVRVRGRPLRGAWQAVDEELWTRLGPTGSNQRLGQGAMLGTRFWDPKAGLTLVLGPLGWRHFLRLLPGRRGFTALHALTRFALGPGLRVGVELRVAPGEVPALPLSACGGVRLGWSSWLLQRPGLREERTVVLSTRHLDSSRGKEGGS
jgi:type VI secretion system protein ImpH